MDSTLLIKELTNANSIYPFFFGIIGNTLTTPHPNSQEVSINFSVLA